MKKIEITKYGSARTVGQHFDISIRSIQRLADSGIINRYRIGQRLTRYSFAEVESALKGEPAK